MHRSTGLAALAVLALAPAAAQAAVPAPITQLASRPAGFGPLPNAATNDSRHLDASSDGDRVLFVSCADNVLVGDDDRACGVYVRDVVAGTTKQLVSVPRDGDVDGALSGDGSTAAITTQQPLLPQDGNGTYDVYRVDVASAATTLVSQTAGGQAGDSASYGADVDSTGGAIAFTSQASDLVADDEGGHRQAFLRSGGTTTLVSRANGAAGTISAGDAEATSISGDGLSVAFRTRSSFSNSDQNVARDVYVRKGTATLLGSRASGGGLTGDSDAEGGFLSSNGRRVAFTSDDGLAAGAPDDGTDQVFLRNFDAGTTTYVSRAEGAAGAPSTRDTEVVGIDGPGDAVAFVTDAALDPADTTGESRTDDLYVRRITSVSTVLASRATGIAPADHDDVRGTITADGQNVVLTTTGRDLDPAPDPDVRHVWRRSLTTGTVSFVDQPAAGQPLRGGLQHADASEHALSADGSRIAFDSDGNALSDADDDAYGGAFVRDLRTGAVTLVSRADGLAGAPAQGEVNEVVLSGDGRRAAFSITGPGLDPADTGRAQTVYVRDLESGRTFYAGQGDPTEQCFVSGLDHTGRRVAMRCSGDLLGLGLNQTGIYVRDLEAGTTVLASRGDGASGVLPNDHSNGGGAFSADGRYVTFLSDATNLEGGGPALYVRDLLTGTTRLASRADGAAGAPVAEPSYLGGGALSADGRKALFVTEVEVTADDVAPGRDAYVRDLVAGTTTLASGRTGDGDVPYATLAASGTTVAYGLQTDAGTSRFVRDLGGAPVLVSRADGADGAIAVETDDEGGIALDGTGACAAFTSAAPELDARIAAIDHRRQVYTRGTCPEPAGDGGGGGEGGGGGGQGGGGQGGGGTTPDRVAPVLRGVKLSRTTFAVGPKRTVQSAATKRGTTLSFSLSERATVLVAVQRRASGRRSGARCVKPTAKLRAKGAKRCTRYVAVTSLRRSRVPAGAAKIAFTGRVGTKKLGPGRYRFALVAVDAAGNRSKEARVAFTVRSR